jgi:hypothetical protein
MKADPYIFFLQSFLIRHSEKFVHTHLATNTFKPVGYYRAQFVLASIHMHLITVITVALERFSKATLALKPRAVPVLHPCKRE